MTNSTRILRRQDVRNRIGLPKSTIYALIKKGQFPAPIKLSERNSGWLESEIDSWVSERVQASRPATSSGSA